MIQTLLAVGFSATTVLAQLPLPGSKEVDIQTDDGVQLAATYYAPTGRAIAPAAILLPKYRSKRQAYHLLVPKLQEAGFAVLAVDHRGMGQSIYPEEKKLTERMVKRDPTLYRNMTKDIDAAVKWIRKQPNVDQDRLVLVSASTSCGAAFDYASKNPVTAIVALTPVKQFSGVDTDALLKKASKTPILFMATELDRKVCEQLASSHDNVEVQIIGEGKARGTNLFVKIDGTKEAAVEFLTSYAIPREPAEKEE